MMSGRQLVSVSRDRTVRQWDLQTGNQINSVQQNQPINCFDVSQTESQFITGHRSGDIKIWSLTQLKTMSTVSKVHSEMIESCVITPSGRHIISAGRDHQIKVTDFNTLRVL